MQTVWEKIVLWEWGDLKVQQGIGVGCIVSWVAAWWMRQGRREGGGGGGVQQWDSQASRREGAASTIRSPTCSFTNISSIFLTIFLAIFPQLDSRNLSRIFLYKTRMSGNMGQWDIWLLFGAVLMMLSGCFNTIALDWVNIQKASGHKS